MQGEQQQEAVGEVEDTRIQSEVCEVCKAEMIAVEGEVSADTDTRVDTDAAETGAMDRCCEHGDDDNPCRLGLTLRSVVQTSKQHHVVDEGEV